MLISQTLSPITTPGLREALLFGGDRDDWHRVFDEAASFRHDDAVLRVLENEARREERRREQGRKLIWCAPAPAAASVGRPHIFRAAFQKDIGGVAGVSDVWADCDFIAVDGGSGKLQSLVDYIDNSHLFTQASASNQCAVPAADALFSNAKVAAFRTAIGVRYTSNRSPSLWRHLHDMTGATIYIVSNGVSAGAPAYGNLFATSSGSTSRGVQVGLKSTGKYFFYSNKNPSGTIFFKDPTTGGIAFGTPAYLQVRLSANLNYAIYHKNTLSDSGTATTPDAGDPGATLCIGNNTAGGGQLLNADVRSLYILRRDASAAQHAIIQSFITKDTGIT